GSRRAAAASAIVGFVALYPYAGKRADLLCRPGDFARSLMGPHIPRADLKRGVTRTLGGKNLNPIDRDGLADGESPCVPPGGGGPEFSGAAGPDRKLRGAEAAGDL